MATLKQRRHKRRVRGNLYGGYKYYRSTQDRLIRTGTPLKQSVT